MQYKYINEYTNPIIKMIFQNGLGQFFFNCNFCFLLILKRLKKMK